MYMFYAYSNGYIPMGNDGQLVVPKSIKSRRALMKLAQSFLGNRAGRVYLMTSWTQQMCELDRALLRSILPSMANYSFTANRMAVTIAAARFS